VPELADTKRTVEAMVEAGDLLKSKDNADAIIMGCAGMADYRQTIEDCLQIPVIEPGQAAVAVATTAARQGW
jgi:Asp/Glu/hydantoin racemase